MMMIFGVGTILPTVHKIHHLQDNPTLIVIVIVIMKVVIEDVETVAIVNAIAATTVNLIVVTAIAIATVTAIVMIKELIKFNCT